MKKINQTRIFRLTRYLTLAGTAGVVCQFVSSCRDQIEPILITGTEQLIITVIETFFDTLQDDAATAAANTLSSVAGMLA